jgi:hypothetical protein
VTKENVVIMFSDTTALSVYSGNDKDDSTPDYERYGRSSAPAGSVGHYIK